MRLYLLEIQVGRLYLCNLIIWLPEEDLNGDNTDRHACMEGWESHEVLPLDKELQATNG